MGAPRAGYPCDTPPVDYLIDNAVELSAIFLGLALLAGLAVAAVAGLRLWKTVKRTQRIVTERAAVLAAEADRITRALDALPQRQGEVAASVALLRTRAQAIGVVGRAAAEALVILRQPLRYLSG